MPARLYLVLAVAGISCADGAAARDSSVPESVSAAPPVSSAPSPTKPGCPATGLWSQCALLERLDRSGLAPRLDSTVRATEPPLTVPGFLVRVGRADLEVYLYDSQSAREREQRALDRTRYVDYTSPPTMEQQSTLIASANALAILHSMNSQLRERVGDAITAGAPAKAP